MDDVRWIQRFSNFVKAFDKLKEGIQKIESDYKMNKAGQIDEDAFLDDIIKEGIIQRFEYTHELAWKVIKDFLSDVGNVKIYGSKDATKEAFSAGLITDGAVWMDMITARNMTSHTYNEDTANDIFEKILVYFYPVLKDFRNQMEVKRSGKQGKLFGKE